MSEEDELTQRMRESIERSLNRQIEAANDSGIAAQPIRAKLEVDEEEQFLAREMRHENLLDVRLARRQREEYAGKVFLLVGLWIAALLVMLLAQATSLSWHPFSDSVLIALISSMTVNLIGTLVIVLKYIFREPK